MGACRQQPGAERRRLIVQAGAFGEHDFTQATVGNGGEGATVAVNGKYLAVELPPSTAIRIAAGVLLSVFGGGDDPSGEAPGTPPQHAVDR